MSERLPVQTVSIPTKALANEAADIAIAAFREAGIDPRKALRNEMAIALVMNWRDGNCNRATFIHACRNLLIMNPGLGEST